MLYILFSNNSMKKAKIMKDFYKDFYKINYKGNFANLSFALYRLVANLM